MNTRTVAARLVPVLGSLLLAGCATLGGPAAGPQVAVSATGRVSTRPDVALVTVGTEARAPALAEATADVAARMRAVLERVRALGVADQDVSTVGYTVEPRLAPRRAEDEPVRIVAYHATNLVQLRIRRIDDAGRVLDAAVAAGANAVRGLQFTLADPGPAEAEARALAVRAAEAKARQIAAAAGATLGEPLAIVEGVAGRVVPRDAFAQAAIMAAPGAPGPVEPGQLEVVVTVEARYALRRGP